MRDSVAFQRARWVKASEVEVGVEVAVEAGEDVEVEGGGDAGCVVVGGEEVGDGFVGAGGEVGAEEESVAGLELGAEVGEDGGGFVGREVADAGADVEGERASVAEAIDAGGLGGVVGDLGADGDAGDVVRMFSVASEGGCGRRRWAGRGRFACWRTAALRRMPVLVAVPAPSSTMVRGWAVLDAALPNDFVGVGGEEGALGAGEVVLGEVGDLFEEVGAGLVVEEPGGEGFWGWR